MPHKKWQPIKMYADAQNVRKKLQNRDKVGFHFSCFLNLKIHILTHNQRFLSRHPYHNNISLKDKTAKPAFKTYITCSQAPPAPTHANIQPCLTKPFHLYLVIFR
jgi:hypothetical protein